MEQIVFGMPHRGRLNVLAHVIGKPLEVIFGEFEATALPEEVQGHGDVKYHLGYHADHRTRGGADVHLDLHYNPSHLEFVNPVVLGRGAGEAGPHGRHGARGAACRCCSTATPRSPARAS